MLNLIKGAWAGLDPVGRTTLIICVAVVLIAAILSGVDLSAARALLGV